MDILTFLSMFLQNNSLIFLSIAVVFAPIITTILTNKHLIRIEEIKHQQSIEQQTVFRDRDHLEKFIKSLTLNLFDNNMDNLTKLKNDSALVMHLFNNQTTTYLYEYMELINEYIFTGCDANNRKKQLYDHIYKESVSNLIIVEGNIKQLGNTSYKVSNNSVLHRLKCRALSSIRKPEALKK